MIPGTLKLTASLPLKMDGWKTIALPFGFRPIFRCELAVSFREGTLFSHLFADFDGFHSIHLDPKSEMGANFGGIQTIKLEEGDNVA